MEKSGLVRNMNETKPSPCVDSDPAARESGGALSGTRPDLGCATGPGFFGCHERFVDLRPGLQVVLGDFRLGEPRSFRFYGAGDTCDLAFVLSGSIGHHLSCMPGEVILSPLQAAVWLTPEMEGRHECASDENIRFVCIRIQRSVLTGFVGADIQNFPTSLRTVLEGRGAGLYLGVLPMTAPMQVSVGRVFCPFHSGSVGRLMLESCALELIAHVVVGLDESRVGGRGSGRYDDHIRQACRVLLDNMASPPGLTELSRIVGMSESLLTREFRKVHGVSVFEFLRTQRLEKARELLESGAMNATDVAYALGFSSPGHFSRLFFKRFQLNPGAFRRRSSSFL